MRRNLRVLSRNGQGTGPSWFSHSFLEQAKVYLELRTMGG